MHRKPRSDPAPGQEACLHRRGGACSRCVQCCVGEDLTTKGFHRDLCQEVLRENERAQGQVPRAEVCAKCLVEVPCKSSHPLSSQGGPGRYATAHGACYLGGIIRVWPTRRVLKLNPGLARVMSGQPHLSP